MSTREPLAEALGKMHRLALEALEADEELRQLTREEQEAVADLLDRTREILDHIRRSLGKSL